MQPVDLLMFDLDGTLVDTRLDLANSINHARERYGLPALQLPEVMKYVGDGIHKLLQRTFPDSGPEKIDEVVAVFRAHYRDHLLDFSIFYPGVGEVLEHFRRKKMAVISNKPEEFVRSILRGLEAHDVFEIILGGDSLPVFKPNPEPILHVLNEVKIAPERGVIIGDSGSDIEAGRQARVLTCAATYGFRDMKTLVEAEPDFMIDDIRQLKKLFE